MNLDVFHDIPENTCNGETVAIQMHTVDGTHEEESRGSGNLTMAT